MGNLENMGVSETINWFHRVPNSAPEMSIKFGMSGDVCIFLETASVALRPIRRGCDFHLLSSEPQTLVLSHLIIRKI